MVRRLVISVVATTCLAGCTAGGSSPEPTPKMPSPSSSSTSTAPSPTEPVEPTPPPEMEGDDIAGAEAFVEYYFARWDHAMVDGDTSALERIAFPTCGPCAGVAKGIDGTYKNGGTVKGGLHDVQSVRLSENSGVAGVRIYVGTATVKVTAQTISGSGLDGLDGNYPAGSDTYQLVVVHDKRGWHMGEWSTK